MKLSVWIPLKLTNIYIRKLCGPEGRLMELPVRASKPFQGGLFWKAPGWYCSSTLSLQHCMFLLTFFQWNKTLVEASICSNMEQSRAHGGNQNICLKSTVLTSLKLFRNMDTPRKKN